MNSDQQIEEMAKGLATARNCICIGREKPCNECNWREGCYFIECCKTLTDQGYRKASEIFEEIEENYADFLFDGYRNIIVITEKDYNELKKKYTEGKDD